MAASGIAKAAIGRKFGISARQVTRIATRAQWARIA